MRSRRLPRRLRRREGLESQKQDSRRQRREWLHGELASPERADYRVIVIGRMVLGGLSDYAARQDQHQRNGGDKNTRPHGRLLSRDSTDHIPWYAARLWSISCLDHFQSTPPRHVA